jgi:hypothetical protein
MLSKMVFQSFVEIIFRKFYVQISQNFSRFFRTPKNDENVQEDNFENVINLRGVKNHTKKYLFQLSCQYLAD